MNNAGNTIRKPFLETSYHDIDAVVDVHLRGVLEFLRPIIGRRAKTGAATGADPARKAKALARRAASARSRASDLRLPSRGRRRLYHRPDRGRGRRALAGDLTSLLLGLNRVAQREARKRDQIIEQE